MLRSAIPRGPLLPASVPGCTCARQASHYPASLSTASHPPPPPPLAPSTAHASNADLSAAYDNPAWSDPAYVRRYRDPARRDVFPSQAAGQLHSKRPLATRTRAARSDARNVEGEAGMPALQSTSASASEPHHVADGANGNGKRPRRNRLEMEALWSGGDFSPPIPLESYKAQTTRPKHALLFPGSGSQYVQMGYFLRQTPAAQEVWAEAEHALHGFEEWRRGLHLHELPGEAGELGRMLDETEAARSRETRLKDIVFEGPQDELTRSSNAQPAILITSIAFLRALEVRCAAISSWSGLRSADQAHNLISNSTEAAQTPPRADVVSHSRSLVWRILCRRCRRRPLARRRRPPDATARPAHPLRPLASFDPTLSRL